MSNIESVVESYVASWNETDPDRRKSALAASCAANAFSFSSYFARIAFLKARSSGLSALAAAFAAAALAGAGC